VNQPRGRQRIKELCAFMIPCVALALCQLAVTKSAGAQVKQSTQPIPQTAGQQSSASQLVAQMPPVAPSKPYHFPPVATKTLANGMRIFVVSSPESPEIGVQLWLTSAGAVNDPAGKPGVAALAASLLTQGTEKRTAQQIAEAIDFVGGTLSATTSEDLTIINASVVNKDFDLAMDLLSDVTLHAKFQPEEIERQRQQLLSNLRISYDDADYLATAVFQRVVYGTHPYGLPGEGTPGSVQAIKRDDLVQFRDNYFSPGTALLAFSGDITPDAAFAAAEKYFGAWQARQVSAPAHPAPPNETGIHVYAVNKPDAVQTQIRIGKPGIRRNDPDYIPLYVSNRIFGGSYNSRLNTEVRIKKGLTYGANTVWDVRREAGSILASTFTRTEATVDATKLVVDQMKGMASGNLKPEELNFARDYLVGVYPIQTETPEQVAGRVLTVAMYGLPADYNDTYPSRIAAVTLAQANAQAVKYFQPSGLDIVLAGNVAQFREALKKQFPDATYEEIPAAEIDLLLPALHRQPETIPAPTPETLAQGKSLLLSGAQAVGAAALDKVQSLEFVASGKTQTAQGEFPIQLKLYLSYPDHYRMDTKISFSVSTSPADAASQPPSPAPYDLVLAFDGKTGWVSAPDQGAAVLPPAQNVEFIRRILLTGGWGLYRAAKAGTIQAQSLGQRDFQGQKADAVVVTSGDIQVTIYFDPATHFAAGVLYPQDTPQGRVESVEVWSDYREVDGVKFPCHNVSYRNGQKFAESAVQEVKINTNLTPSLFVKP